MARKRSRASNRPFKSTRIIYTGKAILEMGFPPGKYFGKALELLNQSGKSYSKPEAFEIVTKLYEESLPKEVDQDRKYLNCHLSNTGTDYERENYKKVTKIGSNILSHPKVVDVEILSDACPSGDNFTIPVGVVAGVENAIIPEMHSADIACSLYTSYLDIDIFKESSISPDKTIFDDIFENMKRATHFGDGINLEMKGSFNEALSNIQKHMKSNLFLQDLILDSSICLGTQGDGNHFFTLGVSSEELRACLISHSGSRRLGAKLFRKGNTIAKKMTGLKRNAYIPADSDEGQEYLKALSIIQSWTELNHKVIHNYTALLSETFIRKTYFNTHNMVYPGLDNIYYHAKGATPLFEAYPNETPIKAIPINMKDPILMVTKKSKNNLNKFAPHGAGRLISRSQFLKDNEDSLEILYNSEVLNNVKYHPFLGHIDYSEMPSAYKSFEYSEKEIKKLTTIVDKIEPWGTIMAGRSTPYKLNKD